MFQAGSLVVWGVGHVDGKMVRFLLRFGYSCVVELFLSFFRR